MKKTILYILLFILLLISVIALWYLSISYMVDKFGVPTDISSANDLFDGINSLYSGLALAGIVFVIYMLIADVKANQVNLENMIRSNNSHLQIIALSSLIQECDATLHRYDRWEEAGILGDYMNAKASVRDKMNAYRDSLDKKYEEMQAADLKK